MLMQTKRNLFDKISKNTVSYRACYRVNHAISLEFAINAMGETQWTIDSPFGTYKVDSATASALLAGKNIAQWFADQA